MFAAGSLPVVATMTRHVLFLCVWLVPAFAVTDSATEVVAGEKRPLVLQVRVDNEPITPDTARYIERAIHQADEQGAECLIVLLDIDQQPKAMIMRYLQTLVEVGAEHNTTLVFPVPLDMFAPLLRTQENLDATE